MKYLKKFNESFEGNDWEDLDPEEAGLDYDSMSEDELNQDDEYDLEDCYAMAYDKIDKMLPADSDLQAEFYEIIDSKDEITTKYTEMEEFFVINIDEDRFDSYCKNGNLKDFAVYVVQKELDIEEEE
jgi:hypothetical protein